MPDAQPQTREALDSLGDSPNPRGSSLADDAERLIAETEAELAQRELQAAAAAAASGQQAGTEAQRKTLTPLGRKWADSAEADMARRTGALDPSSSSVSIPPSLPQVFEGADGPEADEAWRSLVAKHPDATVIDDYLIALPSEDGKSQQEPEPEMATEEDATGPSNAAPDSSATRAASQPQRKHGVLRRLGMPLVWIAALLWVWQIVRTKRLRPPAREVAAAVAP